MDEAAAGKAQDVIIIGAGPAGSMLACALSRLGIQPLVIDADPVVHLKGRGDALMPRTIEVLYQLGNAHPGTSVGDLLVSRATKICGLAGYSSHGTSALGEGTRQPMLELLDTDHQYILGVRQGRVEEALLQDFVRTRPSNADRLLRSHRFEGLRKAGDLIEVDVVETATNRKHTFTTRYLIGADGGRSSVRKALEPHGVQFLGTDPEDLWCAIDLVGYQTTLPDSRLYCLLENQGGSLMLIPREEIRGKPCIRLYVQMQVAEKVLGTTLSRETASQDHAILAAKTLLAPYELRYEEVDWFTAYPVARRLASRFDVDGKIFLMGDACHTHSPKGGLGMNTSMMDAHNLSWKLALVSHGFAKPELLASYNVERRRVAEELLEFDAAIIQLFRKMDGKEGLEHKRLHDEWRRLEQTYSLYHMGVGITYTENAIVQPLNGYKRVPNGHRILPAVVRRYRDLRVVPLLQDLTFRVSWRLLVFAGDLIRPQNAETATKIANVLREDERIGLWLRTRAPAYTWDSHQEQGRQGSGALLEVKLLTSTSAFHPSLRSVLVKGPWDDGSVFCDDVPALSNLDLMMYHGKWRPGDDPAYEVLSHPAHQRWDIDPRQGGRMFLVRPDGHVTANISFDCTTDTASIAAFVRSGLGAVLW